jgi:hypothetical protein
MSKVNNAIEVTYQASNAQTGLVDVTMVIYDETHTLDGVNFPDVVMTEIGVTGRYYGSFTPDVVGNWTILIDSITIPGKVVKKYKVALTDVDTVAGGVAALENISTADVALELANYDAPTKAELDTIEDNVRGVDDDTLKTLSDQIDNISTVAPPMIG